MADQTKYNPSVAWSTIAANVYQLTRETVNDPATYRMTVTVLDSQETGAGTKDTDCYFTDNLGLPYTIIATASTTIDVEDSFRTGNCPTSGKIGYVHKSAYKGQSLFLPSFAFRKLHPLAASNNNMYAMSILWRNDPNSRRILFTSTDTPELRPYNTNYTDIDGVVFNPFEDYGNKPTVKLLLTDNDGNILERTEKPYLEITDGNIAAIQFGQLDTVTDWIIEIRN